jgi:DnaJ homolog subfamily C member 5
MDNDNHGSNFKNQQSRRASHTGTSLYLTLGIDRGATPEEVKRAYRKLALKCHPDKNPNDPVAADRFKEINHANSILSDPTKRSIYDQYGSMGVLLMERLGEENARMYLALNHPIAKCCILFWFCATMCCCCLCCYCCFNFCCGRCAPNVEDEVFTDGPQSNEPPVITSQPSAEHTPLYGEPPPVYTP